MTTRWWMIAVAIVAAAVGSERLWERSQFYRRQPALCAFFEHQCLWYAAQATTAESDENYDAREDRIRQLEEGAKYRAFKEHYHRIYHHSWESLPPTIPPAVNPWDLQRLSASEIEELILDHSDGNHP